MKYLLKNLKKYRKESILAPLFKMLEALFDLFVPLVVQDIINVGIRDHNTVYILQRCGLMVGLAVVGLVCSITAQYFSARAAVGCATGLRHHLFSHIQTLNFSEIDRIGPSTLITRMTSDINQVQNGLNMFLRLFLRSPFIVFGAMIMAFTIHPRIAFVFAVVIPVLFVIIFIIMKWTSPLYKKVQTKLDGVLGITRENLSGVRVIRAFNKEESETDHFHESNEQLNKAQLHVGRISGLMNPLTYTAVNLGIIAILYMSGKEVNNGSLMYGGVIALINYASQILVELIKFANTVVLLSRASASLNRLETVMDTKPSMIFPDRQATASISEEAVRFNHVSLRYQGAGEESLTDISFCAMRGQTIGVIGGTGSGKTSLVSLISRFYDATDGQVKLLGKPITDWTKEELRSHVGVVMQRAQLFTGTIRSNLQWGKPDATDKQLEKALETAQALDFVRKKPLGLDEPVEQGGRNFSGGQRQRLTIARALVKEPKILILDDSASALDFATDAALRKALRKLPDDITVFIVSQRTSSLQHADRILVLEDGCLVGCGSHDDLLKECQVYREIYESQFQ